jgi:hypothetical protein
VNPFFGTWIANIEKSRRHIVSEDGKTLTATVGGIDAAGKPFDHIVVFDRA